MASMIKNKKIWQTVWFSLLALGAIFGIVWTWAAAPIWWPSALALLEVVGTFVMGISVTLKQEAPEPPEV